MPKSFAASQSTERTSMKLFIIPPLFAMLFSATAFAQWSWAVDPQPTLAPACVCHGPSDPKCKCGKACQCVPAKPKPVVSVMKPPAPKYICENGVCRPVQAPASTISPWGPYGPGQEKSPISAIEIQKQKNEDQCERDYLETMRKYYPSQQGAASAYPNGVCRPAQSPVPAKAAPKVESRTAPTVQAGGCSSCSGVRSYPVRRGLFGWRR